MSKTETRVFPLTDCEVRSEGDSLSFEGYAAVFNSLSEDLGGFREQIDPAAFNKTLKEADVRSLINHDPSMVLGRNKAGTLKLSVDANGLRVVNKLPDTSYARDLHELLQRGDVNQMSFAFTKIRDSWDEETSPPTRTLREVRLHDVSVVTYPAYPETSAEARALAASITGDPMLLEGLDINFRAISALEQELRQGKMLSAKNMDIIRAAMEALMSLMNAAEPDTSSTQEENTAPDTSATRLSVHLLARDLDLLEATL